MPRLFTGLEIPGHESEKLAVLRGGLPGARWIEPADYHVTLRFIGDVGLSLANEIARELDGLRHRQLSVAIESLHVFGGDRPRSIVARVAVTDTLCTLQVEHERLMRRLGLPAEPRKFLPHVTLARLRNTSATDAAAYIESRGAFEMLHFQAPRFVLYSSKDSGGGGPYRVEAAYPP